MTISNDQYGEKAVWLQGENSLHIFPRKGFQFRKPTMKIDTLPEVVVQKVVGQKRMKHMVTHVEIFELLKNVRKRLSRVFNSRIAIFAYSVQEIMGQNLIVAKSLHVRIS